MSTTTMQPSDAVIESVTHFDPQSTTATDSGSKEFRIRLATKADVPAIVALLADAFQDGDPITEWIFPGERTRRRRQHRMLAALIRHRHIPVESAEVAVSGNEIVGASLFQRSWTKPTRARRILGDLALLRAMRSRVFAGSAVDTALDGAAPPGDHISLVHLACESSWASSGVGTALFLSLFAKSFDRNAALYGVMKPENFTYYTSVLVNLATSLGGDKSYVDAGIIPGEVTIGRGGPTLKTLWGHPHYGPDPDTPEATRARDNA